MGDELDFEGKIYISSGRSALIKRGIRMITLAVFAVRGRLADGFSGVRGM